MRPLLHALAALLITLPVAAEETAKIDWYGYVRLDMAHDSAVTTAGNYALYVKPHPTDDATSTLNTTARQTRLGMRIAKGTMTGKVEFDFYGASPENKNTVMLRHAVFSIPLGAFTLEGGQTWDMFSPLYPTTVNYPVLWGAGNVGYRRPQLRLIHKTQSTYAGVSLARNITGDLDGDTVVDGDASAVPAVQARCALTPLSGDPQLTVGLSGHYGKCNCPSKDIDYSNWSVNGDVSLVVGTVKLLAEGYRGSNMGQYAGAIYNSDLVNGVHSTGGWVNLQKRLDNGVVLSVGAGLDDVDEEDLTESHTLEDGSVQPPVANARIRNQAVFVAALVPLTPEVHLGVEASHWSTQYGNVSVDTEPEPTSLRLQLALQAGF